MSNIPLEGANTNCGDDTLDSYTSTIFAQSFMAYLLHDEEIAKLAFQHLDAPHFHSITDRMIYTTAKNHFEQYGTLAPPQLFLCDNVVGSVYGQRIALYDPKHSPWYKDKATDYIKHVRQLAAKREYESKKDLDMYIRRMQATSSIGLTSASCFRSLSQLLDLGCEHDWLIEGLVYRKSMSVLAGDYGAGKTIWLIQLLTDYMFGSLSFNGVKAISGRVCWVDYDANGAHFRRAMLNAIDGRSPDAINDKFYYASNIAEPDKVAACPPVLNVQFLDTIKMQCNPDIIVIDPLKNAFALTDGLSADWLNSAGEVAKLISPIHAWAHNNNIAIILIHHNNRSGTFAGSYSIMSDADLCWYFSRNKSRATVEVEKRLPEPSKTTWTYDGYRYSQVDLIDTNTQTSMGDRQRECNMAHKAAKAIWDYLAIKQATQSDLENNAKPKDLDRSYFRTIVKSLESCKAIQRQNKKTPFSRGNENAYITWCSEHKD